MISDVCSGEAKRIETHVTHVPLELRCLLPSLANSPGPA